MKLTIITNFNVQYEADKIKRKDGKVYFKRNLSDKKWDYVNPGDVKYIKISENKSL
jgi:hypothetical protein